MGNPNHVYVLATEDNTSIYVYDAIGTVISSSPYTFLNQGQQALIVVPGGSKFAYITSNDANKPFYTFQLGVENQARAGALVPAIGCTGNTQLAFTRARNENKFQFFIIVKKENQDKFVLDGVKQTDTDIIKPGAFTEIPGAGGYMAWFSNSINTNTLLIGQHLIENTGDLFHLGIFNGSGSVSQGGLFYGFYTDFGGLNVGANIAGTNSQVVRACYGDSVQLFAFGGTNYLWTPDTYLDDATSNIPTAINLPPGPHNYTVEVSGACNNGIVDLTILVAEPVVAFFQTNVSAGCSPLEVRLEDQSSGAYSWQYKIGDSLIIYDLDPNTSYGPPPNYPESFSVNYTYRNITKSPIVDTVSLIINNVAGCAHEYTHEITVFPAATGGNLIGGVSPVTFGDSTGTISLVGHVGTIVSWQKRIDSGLWSDISNTSETFSEIPISTGIWEYRVHVKSGTCSEAYSDTLIIEVLPKEIIITPVDDQSKNEGEPDPVFLYTNSEWSDNLNISGFLGRESGEIAGYYTYKLGSLSAGPYYKLILNSSSSGFTIMSSTGIEELNLNDGILLRNLPNPFRTNTTIKYNLPSDSWVTITIYNAYGQSVKTTMNNEMRAKGIYDLITENWFPEAGVYYVTLKLKSNNKEFIRTIKLVKIK